MIVISLALVSIVASGAADTTRSAKPAPITPTPAPAARPALVADSIVVEKGERKLTLFYRGLPVKSYGVALGRNPIGDKEFQGDGRTPEGVFHIESRNANSKYHLALRISYPDVTHLMRAEALGTQPGGDIMLHGLPRGYESVGAAHRDENWTEGCVALTNDEIEEIWRAVPDGTPIEIKP